MRESNMAANAMHHAQFLRTMQDWVRSYVSTAQLSPNDLFHIVEWAQAGVRAQELTAHFDRYLALNPDFFKDGFKLSRLRFEAERFIASIRKNEPERLTEPMLVSDPFVALIELVTQTGRATQNDFVRAALRQLWKSLKQAHQTALVLYPDWNQTPAAYYHFKAFAIMANCDACKLACEACTKNLSPEECRELTKLTPQERIHAMQLGEDALRRYHELCRLEKIAAYFELEKILHYFDAPRE